MKSIQFFKGLSWLIVLNVLVKPIWTFFIDRQVQILVGYEEYGKYFAVLNLSYVLFFLSDAGLGTMLNQKLANNLPVNVRQIFQVKILLVLSYIVLCFFAGWLTHIPNWTILVYVVAIQVFTSLFLFLRSLVTAHQYFVTDAWFSIIDKLLMIVCCGAVIYTSVFGQISLNVFLQLQTLCLFVAVAITFFFIYRKNWITRTQAEDIDSIVRQIVPFGLIILLMSMHYRLDGFLLERIHARGAYEAGVYAAAYRLLDATNMIGYLAASFLVPFIARHQNEKKLLDETIIDTRHGLLFFSIGIACFGLMYAPWIEKFLYHSDNAYNASVIGLCLASLPGYYLTHVYGSMLTASRSFRKFTTILVISVLINIILNLVLIPLQGALGCCIAALVSQYFCGVACCISSTRSFGISYHPRSILVYLFSAGLLVGIFYLGRLAVANVWLVLFIAVCITLALLTTQISFFKKYFVSLR